MNIFATQIEWNTQMNCAKWLEHHQNRHYVHYILFPDPLQKKQSVHSRIEYAYFL